MKKRICLKMAVLAIIMFFNACQKNDLNNELQVERNVPINSEVIAKKIVNLLQEDAILQEIVSYFETNKFGGSLEDILEQTSTISKGVEAKEALVNIVTRANIQNEKAERSGVVEIPELWMFTPANSYKSSEVLISFVPEGDEKDWENIKAFDLQGNVVLLNPNVAPKLPVIVVELNGMETLKQRVALMNKELQTEGLQRKRSLQMPQLKAAAGLETTKIQKIRLNNDQEPWIKGAAEVYAITSGIRGDYNNKEAEIAIVAMPYLDKDKRDYYPNQIILFWDDYDFQAANIQLYEQDSNYNYKELVSIIVSGVFEITGILTAEPWVGALGKIASAIVQVMPDKWYTDDDDYIDSYYTILKDKTYTNYNGAGGNAKITMNPFFVPAN